MSFPQQAPNPFQQPPYPPAQNQPVNPNPPFKPAGFPDETPLRPASNNGCLWGCLFAGLLAFLLLIAGCIGTVVYLKYKGKELLTNFARQGIVAGIEGSELTKEDKQQVI